MSSAVMTPPRTMARRSTGPVRQLPTHAHLYHHAPPLLPTSSRTRRDAPDAIVVPASRPASALNRLIDLAADLGTELVVLGSGQTNADQVAERMRRVIGSRGVVAEIDDQYRLPTPSFGTSKRLFSAVNGDRCSDLSTKRNAGLLLARLCGWSKIVFVDDDIMLDRAHISRIVHSLNYFSIAGMRTTTYADNSVLCHARRLAKLPQGIFVSGAVLGVNCDAPDLAFFPNIYNEDWFFFGEAAAARGLPKPGEVRQSSYDPFVDPDRARHEEFGDLLAEGLYSLIDSSGLDSFEDVVELASERYWSDFIDVRLGSITEAGDQLSLFLERESCGDNVSHAIHALEAARRRYDAGVGGITPGRCVEFLEAWRKDTATWRGALPRRGTFLTTSEAMDRLNVSRHCSVL